MRKSRILVLAALTASLSGCWLDSSTPAPVGPANDADGGKIDDTVATPDTTDKQDVAASSCTVGDAKACPGGFCEVAQGQCTGTGKCSVKPSVCTQEYGPVCGCDGKDYTNPCYAKAAGVNVDKGGSCAPGPGTCSVGDNSTCPGASYCAAPVGTCSGTSGCAAKPQACDMIYAPVCGCDGKTYSNDCAAAAAGVVVAKSGACAVASNLKWFYTCGAPVCSGVQPTPTGMNKCTTEKAGDSCSTADALCDPQDSCARHLKCTDKDPRQGPGGCPISRRDFKSDIQYLQQNDEIALSQELLQTRLATYRYTAAGPQAPRHLGFIIDDRPDSPAVDAKRDMVDLYGYLSMSVATLQVQQRQIEALQQQLGELRQSCGQGAAMSRR